MGKFISCGEFDKNYICLYIVNLLVYLGILLSSVLAEIYSINKNVKGKKYYNYLLTIFLIYIGQSLSFLIQLVINKTIQNTSKNNKKQNTRISPVAIKYIFNEQTEKVTKKDLIHIFCFSLLLLLVDFLKLIMTVIYDKSSDIIFIDFFSSLLFSLFILSICKVKYYKHQYFAIIIILIIKIIPFIAQYNSLNINTLYLLLFQIFVSFLDSLLLMYIKALMHFKYFFSPYRTLYIFGIINSILLLIIYFIISFIPCPNNYICNVNYKGETYFDNIFSAFNFDDHIIIEIIGYFLISILAGIYNLLIIITINKYTVCHSLILVGNQEILNLVTLVLKYKIDKIDIIYYVYYFILIFGYLVFLEFIELNCFGLNENTKRNIKKRSNEDSPMLNDENHIYNDKSFKTDDNEDNEDNEENGLKNEENELKNEYNELKNEENEFKNEENENEISK